ncbi:MAG: asparagine synthase-related protein [Vibrio toranzoniae]
MFKYYDCLGSRSYYRGTAEAQVFSSFADCIKSKGNSVHQIDGMAVLSILMKNYSVGDRTLIKGIERTSWMSCQMSDGSWSDAELPKHGRAVVSSSEACKTLHHNLRLEVLNFVSDKNSVGILLSGGMDSRIVAGIVRELQQSGEYTGQVVALTWGIPESRDVVYAKRIADEFGWGFEHFELNADVLKRNIELTAERGAEYSPVHLHAMEQVSKAKGVDGILAGSYGDSIGRGEYSGRRTNKLPGILDKHLNHFAFMTVGAERKALTIMKQVLAHSRARFPGRDEMAYREIDMQMHYMRRQLNACMEVIDDKIPLYQMFGSPATFGYMWSLSSDSRSDDVYEDLLKSLPSVLREIPWARTGKKYNSEAAPVEDSHTALNNRYGMWLRTDLRAYVTELMSNGALQSLGVFNPTALKFWVEHWARGEHPKADRLDEKMAWLASLSLLIEKYNIQPSCDEAVNSSLVDSLNLTKAIVHTKLYHEALKWKRK